MPRKSKGQISGPNPRRSTRIQSTKVPSPQLQPKSKPRKARAPPQPKRTAEPFVKQVQKPARKCPAEGCGWSSVSNDPRRALSRHIRYICTINGGQHRLQEVHKIIYDGMKEERRSDPEKQKKAHKKYRDKNKKKRIETARLHKLKMEVRMSGEMDEAVIERRARELMEERRRK